MKKLLFIMCLSAFVFADAEMRNGEIWKDIDGVHINAHGGALMKDGGKWYWYGEFKTAGNAGNKAWVGVSCYSSVDLVSWKNEGVAFAVSKEAGSPVEEGCILERPKVVKAQDGSGYAMYFHLEPKGSGYSGAKTGIAKSATPVGPFELIWTGRPNKGVRPLIHGRSGKLVVDETPKSELPKTAKAPWGGSAKLWGEFLSEGQMSRDMTLYTDPADGKVYHVFASEDNSCLHLAELRADALGYTGRWTRITPNEWTEAPAIVKHGEWYFLIGSECTGWRANAARYYRAKSVWGPWERMGNPCRGVNPQNRQGPEFTWGGQSTGIFEYEGIVYAMFDIWRPSNAIDGRYVWLPVDFTAEGTMSIEWNDTFPAKRVAGSPLPLWRNPTVDRVGRLLPRLVSTPSPCQDLAVEIARGDKKMTDSPYITDLAGEWDFAWKRSDDSVWTDDAGKIVVPSVWDSKFAGIDAIGRYRRLINVSDKWKGRRIVLNFAGVANAFVVRVNGKEIGYSEGVKTSASFDITPFVVFGGDNRLEVEVHRSYVGGGFLKDCDAGICGNVWFSSEAMDGICSLRHEANMVVDGAKGKLKIRISGIDNGGMSARFKLVDDKGAQVWEGACSRNGSCDAEIANVSASGEYILIAFAAGDFNAYKVRFRR